MPIQSCIYYTITMHGDFVEFSGDGHFRWKCKCVSAVHSHSPKIPAVPLCYLYIVCAAFDRCYLTSTRMYREEIQYNNKARIDRMDTYDTDIGSVCTTVSFYDTHKPTNTRNQHCKYHSFHFQLTDSTALRRISPDNSASQNENIYY